MRKSRFTEEQIIAILAEQGRGMATAEVSGRHGGEADKGSVQWTDPPPSETTRYEWKAEFGGMQGEPWSAIAARTMASDARRLEGLEDETARLRRRLAERMLDDAVLEDWLGKELTTPALRTMRPP